MEGFTLTYQQRRLYTEQDLIKRIKNILLCHFIVGTAHVFLAYSMPVTSKRSYEFIILYLALVLSARRYMMFLNDFNYIHTKKFFELSKVLRYENIPYLQPLLVGLDVCLMVYRFLQHFINTNLVIKDQEMLTFYAYIVIPALILSIVYFSTEEKVVYRELLNPTFEMVGIITPHDPDQ